MKKLFLLIMIVIAAISFNSCSKEGYIQTDNDIILEFKDANFLKALLDCVDRNYDGQISVYEAKHAKEIYVYDCNVRIMDEIHFFPILEVLKCDKNQVTSLMVDENTALKELNCRNNRLTSLYLDKCTALTKLFCDFNQLTSLDVSENTALEYLVCQDNPLTSLNLSRNTALIELICGYNQLTSLDLSRNTELKSVICQHNENLKSIILYKYHKIRQEYIDLIIQEYGDIITYVE